MTQSTFHIHPPSTAMTITGALRGIRAKWRLNRRCEARARELETVLRELDPRLARDIGFDLMASRRSYDGAVHNHALIQAVSIAFAEEPTETM